jgi:hypothetical protein
MIILPTLGLVVLIALGLALRWAFGWFHPVILLVEVLAVVLAYKFLAREIDRGS